jgi:hypothetical protein
LTTKFKAHDEENDARTGDTVLIEESRPLSATKRWRLVEVLARAGAYGSPSDIVAEEEATTEAIHAAAHPGRQHAETAAGEAAADEGAPATDDATDGEPATASADEGGAA